VSKGKRVLLSFTKPGAKLSKGTGLQLGRVNGKLKGSICECHEGRTKGAAGRGEKKIRPLRLNLSQLFLKGRKEGGGSRESEGGGGGEGGGGEWGGTGLVKETGPTIIVTGKGQSVYGGGGGGFFTS